MHRLHQMKVKADLQHLDLRKIRRTALKRSRVQSKYQSSSNITERLSKANEWRSNWKELPSGKHRSYSQSVIQAQREVLPKGEFVEE